MGAKKQKSLTTGGTKTYAYRVHGYELVGADAAAGAGKDAGLPRFAVHSIETDLQGCASQGMMECARWMDDRRSRMTKYLMLLVAVGTMAGSVPLRADDRAPKGPAEDGTLPALVKIAGEGEMNSHAFEFLTELSDDVGARVTGTPAERKAEDWGVAKMQAIGLANVHREKYTIW